MLVCEIDQDERAAISCNHIHYQAEIEIVFVKFFQTWKIVVQKLHDCVVCDREVPKVRVLGADSPSKSTINPCHDFLLLLSIVVSISLKVLKIEFKSRTIFEFVLAHVN